MPFMQVINPVRLCFLTGFLHFQNAFGKHISVIPKNILKKLLTRSCDCGNITHVVVETAS